MLRLPKIVGKGVVVQGSGNNLIWDCPNQLLNLR